MRRKEREVLTKLLGLRVGDRVRIEWKKWNSEGTYPRYGTVVAVDGGGYAVKFDNGGRYWVGLNLLVLVERRR
jgi:hypothetical protein